MPEFQPYQYGVIGGMGFNSTNFFLQRLYERRPAESDQDFPALIVRYATFMPDRTAALHDARLAEEVGRLVCMEVESIRDKVGAYVFLCNTVHHFVRQSPYAADEKRIDMIDMTIEHVNSRKNSAPSVLLATLGTYEAGLYENGAIEAPEPSIREQAHEAIYCYKKKNVREALERLDGVLARFPERVILAGCTEISEMLAMTEKPDEDVICPVSLLAERMAVTSSRREGTV